MSHDHPIVDDDKRFIINPETRDISNNGNKIVLMQYDHNSEVFTFEIPRIIEGHDMTLCNKIKIHFINIDKKTKMESKGIYPINDVKNENDILTFSWCISGKATKYFGSLNFLIQFGCLEDDNTYSYLWHTNLFKSINVLSGCNNSEEVMEEYSDILEIWRSQVLTQLELSNENLAKLDENYNANVKMLSDAVNTADKYIGEYEYEELIVDASKDDWIDMGNGMYALELNINLDFLFETSRQNGFYIEFLYDDSDENIYYKGTSGDNLSCLEGDTLLFHPSCGDTYMFSGGILRNMNHSHEPVESGGIIAIVPISLPSIPPT